MLILFKRDYSDTVSTMVFFLHESSNQKMVVDANSVTMVTVGVLAQWFKTHEVHYGSYAVYSIFEIGHLPNQAITPISQLHQLDINGYLIAKDMTNLTNTLEAAWGTVGGGK